MIVEVAVADAVPVEGSGEPVKVNIPCWTNNHKVTTGSELLLFKASQEYDPISTASSSDGTGLEDSQAATQEVAPGGAGNRTRPRSPTAANAPGPKKKAQREGGK